ncbi:MAG: TIGR04076 family protein [Clostridia bacterium]|nr:TIGR04076 family protein [Clostridia bacterium]
MKQVKITVMKMVRHDDLIEQYENPIEHACDLALGQTFISFHGERPQGLCDSAWESMKTFVGELARGGGNFYDGWMKNPFSAMISCNDGFRPVSFLLETLKEM